jgi:hypothetical protein
VPAPFVLRESRRESPPSHRCDEGLRAAESEGRKGDSTQATIPTVNRTSADCWADGYWLNHCEEFSVETPGGMLGYVASVDPAHEELVVIGDHGATRVPFGDIDFIDPSTEHVVVRLWKEGAR